MTPNDLIAAGCRMAKVLMHRLTADLAPDEFRHQPVPGANSAAWVVGHLASVYRRVAALLGAADLPALPDGLADKLATTKKPAEAQGGLGDPATLLGLFDTYCDAAATAVRTVPADKLTGPSPFKLSLTEAPTFGEGLLFVTGLHTAMHAGQISTVRRSLGKPPVV